MTVRKKKRNMDRIRGLDGIRTIALAGVLLYHTFPTSFPGGFFGVLMFFVISGYLAAYSGVRSLKKGTFSIAQYYKKRLIRLFPELLVVLFCTIGALTIIDPSKMANTQKEVASVLFGYNNFWQIRMNADYFAQLSKSSPFTHLWYIAVLLQFELLWPWFLKGYELLRKKQGLFTAVGTAALLTAASFLIMPIAALLMGSEGITTIYYSTFTRIFSLMGGVFLGILHAERLRLFARHLHSGKTAGWILIGYIVLFNVIFKFVQGTWMSVYILGMPLATFAAMRMIDIVSIRSNHTGRYMDNRIFKLISRYSYEIYLWQYPVLFLCGLLHLSSLWWHYLLQIVLILILSIWLSAFNRDLLKRIAR